MTLDRKPQTVGNRRKYIVDYSQWLSVGITITAASATIAGGTATVDTVSNTTTTVVFFINNGTLNDAPVVTLSITCSNGEIKWDTIDFFVVSP